MQQGIENLTAEEAKAAFAPTNIIPCIDFSPNKMLQRRRFSYGDTQRYRLGVNHWQIPVNYPKGVANLCPFSRDGAMRVDGNLGSHTNYYPNSYGVNQDQPQYRKPALPLEESMYEWNFREDDDNYFEQLGKLFNLMSPEEQHRLFINTANEMNGTT